MIGDIIYNIIISPIEMVIEIIFSIIYKISLNPGFAIIGVSLAINFLVLPLYKKSDELQEKERDKQAEMKPWLDYIKKNFKGDERYLMTQTYYRQQGYKPLYALRSSVSLLLQVPFFIAAYHFLSNLGLLQGASFLFIKDLGQPDQLIPFFGMKLNLLPILMTAINVVSGAIYTRGFPIKDKLQLYGIAAIFLILLYNSPAGLVFYWTLNNIFSLGKNIVMKLLPKREKKERVVPELIGKKFFYSATIFLTLFLGLFIPLMVMKSSPQEFVGANAAPITIAINTVSVFAGMFLLWFSIFYWLAGNRGKNTFTIITWATSGVCVVNYLFAGRDYGNITPLLIYDESPIPSLKQIFINAVLVIAVVLAFIFLIKKAKKLVKAAQFVMIITAAALIIVNTVKIQSSVSSITTTEAESVEDIEPVLTLSKNGDNVIVFMLDRATGLMFDNVLQSNSEVLDYLDGFTYYKNTVSYGSKTNYSTPSLFGGYEYTPLEINKRDSESLRDKHNEAILTMPTIFQNNGYDVTCSDIPYAGDYEWKPNMTIYDEAGMSGQNLEGKFVNLLYGEQLENYDDVQNYNMVRYSILRCLPQVLHQGFYDESKYLSTNEKSASSKAFLESYSELNLLPALTQIVEEGDGFLMMQNASTHEPVALNEEYDITEGSNVPSLNNFDGEYAVHVASIRELGEWFDYLKEEGVYDNTRIVISGDHGVDVYNEDYQYTDTIGDLGCYNPLLLVKDFDSHGFEITDEFMTLADVPSIATSGIITDVVNPFTGKMINSETKESGRIIITTGNDYDTLTNNGNVFTLGDGGWYEVLNKNIFEAENFVEVKN